MAGKIYTVTIMAKMLGVTQKTKSKSPAPIKLNRIMEDLGIQTRINGKWVPTEDYQKYAVYSKNNDIFLWKDELVPILIKGIGKMVADKY